MRRTNAPTDAEVDESQARIAAVLGPAPSAGHNVPPVPIEPDPIEAAAARVEQEVASATEWAEQVRVVETDVLAAQLADKLDQLRKLWQKTDAERVAEKTPHDEKAAAVQAKWKPLLEKLRICADSLKPLEAAWLKLKGQRLDTERQVLEKAAREAQQRADQLAEQAQAGHPQTMIAAKEADEETERARQAVAEVPQRAQVRGTLGGRARSLRRSWHAVAIDVDRCYQHFRDHPEVKAVLTQLGDQAARAQAGPRPPDGLKEGMSPDLPGFWIFSEEG
jgi:hypothetical protein